ncbi:MAG: DUF4215 domain-containing protein [Alphaproteobacteria bacterium]|nr:DUF4215 domain-containing protein [Alphaproteobacteria bacterium]
MRAVGALVVLAVCGGPPSTVAPGGGGDDSGGHDSGPPPSGPVDADGDGYTVPDDCLDSNPLISPAATEICNGLDDDCDGRVDASDAPMRGSSLLRPLYRDTDGDGFGTTGSATWFCKDPGPGWTGQPGDCDDAASAVFPGQGCDELPIDTGDTALWGDPPVGDSGVPGDSGAPVDTSVDPECGNGVVEGDEYCDDHNTITGDGCHELCVWERFRFTLTSGHVSEKNASGDYWDLLDDPDVYVVIRVSGANASTTSVVRNSRFPTWNHVTDLLVLPGQEVQLAFFDDDSGTDDAMSTVRIGQQQLLEALGEGARSSSFGHVYAATWSVEVAP